jgi:Mrp family chromosome partitioning ATPase
VRAESFLGDIARQVMTELQSAFDYVVIDAGAVRESAAPQVLAAHATGTVLVLEKGVARKRASAAKRAIEGGGGRILGVVLAGGRGEPRRRDSRVGTLTGALVIPGEEVGGGRSY